MASPWAVGTWVSGYSIQTPAHSIHGEEGPDVPLLHLSHPPTYQGMVTVLYFGGQMVAEGVIRYVLSSLSSLLSHGPLIPPPPPPPFSLF